MLQCTSAEANKILKKLNEKLDFAQLQLDAANTFLTMELDEPFIEYQ